MPQLLLHVGGAVMVHQEQSSVRKTCVQKVGCGTDCIVQVLPII